MIIVYEGIELMASFIEMFILYEICGILLHNKRENKSKLIDVLMALVGAFIIRICNHVSSFSYFTMLIFTLYVCISVTFIYKTNSVSIFSIVSFYLLSLSTFDFFVLTFVSNFYGGYDTFVSLISGNEISRMVVICIIKLIWIWAYLVLKKYLQ